MPKDIRTRPDLAPLVQSVVHPTDFSPASERAFAYALAIAVLRQTSLTLLHVESGKQGWRGFPAVRKTLERWGLLEPGSAQEDVFAHLGVKVTKLTIDSRMPVHSLLGWLDGRRTPLLEARLGRLRLRLATAASAVAQAGRELDRLLSPDGHPTGQLLPQDRLHQLAAEARATAPHR